MKPGVVYHPRFVFFGLPATARSFVKEIDGAESIDGKANVFKCKITPHLIMMLVIAARTGSCHLSFCSVRTQPPPPSYFIPNLLCCAEVWCRRVIIGKSGPSISLAPQRERVGGCREASRCNDDAL